MMTTMFGFFPEAVDSPWAAVFFASAWASNKLMAGPSGPQVGWLMPGSVAAVSAAPCRTDRGAASAREDGVMPLVPATRPSIAPSPTHASD